MESIDLKKFLRLFMVASALLSTGCVNTIEEEPVAIEHSEEVEQIEVHILLKDVDDEMYINERIEVEEGSTLSEVMEENFNTVIEDGFLESIDEFENDPANNIFIVYDINGEMGIEPVEDLILQDGDKVLWKRMEF